MVSFVAMHCMHCEELVERQCMDLFNTKEDIYKVILEMVDVSLNLERHLYDGFIYEAVLTPVVDVLELEERCLELIGGFLKSMNGDVVVDTLLELQDGTKESILRVYFNPATCYSSDSEEESGMEDIEEETDENRVRNGDLTEFRQLKSDDDWWLTEESSNSLFKLALHVYICNDNNLTSAKFNSNLNTVLNNLVNNTSSSNGFNTSVSGQSPDGAYGLLQCWEDATVEECLSYSQDANTTIRRVCGNALGGRKWREKCFIRYQNFSFFGILDTQTRVAYMIDEVKDQPYVFTAAVLNLLTNLSGEAFRFPIRYSSGSTTASTNYTIYGMVQCWRDLTSVEDCKFCLANAIRNLLDATATSTAFEGGAAGSGSCYARYETYPFFNPPPPQLPLSPLTPGNMMMNSIEQ
ncbi:hypothetical protein SUGI_1181260 [Cryptomeria japonica]|nr:hypothetical protein SUGI_1181260 [Cryptomeria japonica]